MKNKNLSFWILPICFLLTNFGTASAQADTHLAGEEYVDQSLYKNREILPDIFGKPDPSLEKSLTQVKGNLYRHTNGTLPALHSGLVLITKEGAIVIDPAL